MRYDVSDMVKPLGSYAKGTDYVPKTGPYTLHEGEKVVPAKENKMNFSDIMDSVKSAPGKAMAGIKSAAKPDSKFRAEGGKLGDAFGKGHEAGEVAAGNQKPAKKAPDTSVADEGEKAGEDARNDTKWAHKSAPGNDDKEDEDDSISTNSTPSAMGVGGGGMPSHKKGIAFVPKTGPALLHKGERVVNAKDNMADMFDKVPGRKSADENPPKKSIKRIEITKSHNGKHIVKHVHHHPAHEDETHVMNDMAALHSHLEDHAGTPNEGEGPESAPAGAPAQLAASAPPVPGTAPTAVPGAGV
jgi:hypothetical protein